MAAKRQAGSKIKPGEGKLFLVQASQMADYPVHRLYDIYRFQLQDLYKASELALDLKGDDRGEDYRFETAEARIKSVFLQLTRVYLDGHRLSDAIGSGLPVLPLYRPVLVAAEKKIEGLLEEFIIANHRRELIDSAMTNVSDPSYRKIYANTARKIDDLIWPPPRALDEYGVQDLRKPLLVADSGRAVPYTDEAFMADLVRIFGKNTGATADKRPADFLSSSIARVGLSLVQFNQQLLVNLRQTVALLQIVTVYETDQLIAPSLAYLSQLWNNLDEKFRAFVFQSATLDDLERLFTEAIAQRAAETVGVLTSYMESFPLLDENAGVENAPTKRDYSALFESEVGRRIVGFYRLTRGLKFTKTSESIMSALGDELPRNLPFAGAALGGNRADDEFARALTAPLYAGTFTSNVDPMDTILYYFAVVRPAAPGSDYSKTYPFLPYYIIYWDLQRAKVLNANEKDRRKAEITLLRERQRRGESGLPSAALLSESSSRSQVIVADAASSPPAQ